MTTFMQVPHRPDGWLPDAWEPTKRASEPASDDTGHLAGIGHLAGTNPGEVGRPPKPGRTNPPILEVVGVSAKTPDGTRILDDVTFSVERGWLVAVVGPTGAGKTSLMRTLTGRLALEAGEIRLDGQNLGWAASPTLRRRVGYVPQEDLLHPQLRLRRTLEYAASLRLPPSSSATQRSARVKAVLAELNLDRQAKVPVASLSGGQRKRANLALELLSQPDLLVLDEPTSGLDPGHERAVMAMLRGVADQGRTVLAVTHSMQAIGVCDRVIFLATGGQVAFFGPPDEAVAYFELADDAELFTALDSQAGVSWKDRWLSQPGQPRSGSLFRTTQVPRCWEDGLHPAPGLAAHPATPVKFSPPAQSVASVRSVVSHPVWSVVTEGTAPPPGFSAQMSVLVRRYVDLIRSDHRHVAMLLLQGPLLGLLLLAVMMPGGLAPLASAGSLPNNLLGALDPHLASVAVFLAISVTWLGTSSAIREIVKENAIVQRETGAGLSLNAYVSSKIAVLGSLIMGEAVVLTAIACASQAPPANGAVIWWGAGEIMVTTALIGLAAVALGLLLSALVSTPDKAMTVLPIALVAQLVLSGSWGAVAGTPGITQLGYLTGARWGVRAIEATATGNAGAWWSSVGMLVLLTAVTLLGTAALVHRRLGPVRSPETSLRLTSLSRVANPDRVSRTPTVLVPVAAAYMLICAILAAGAIRPHSPPAPGRTTPGAGRATAG
ncbi:MAG: ABC transporter ATP-binding protein [Acidimicrobiales bacterium]